MGIVIRQSIKGTIVLYVGIVLAYFNVAWLMPYCLSAEQIGLIRILIEAGVLFGLVFQFGLPYVIIKYFPHFKDENKKNNGFLFFLLTIPIGGFLVFFVLFVLFKNQIISYYQEKSSLLIDYFYFIVPLTFFYIYNSILEKYANVQLRIVVPNLMIRSNITGFRFGRR